MKKIALAILAVLIAIPASAAGVTISGYIDFGYISDQGGSQNGTLGQASGSTNGNAPRSNGFALNEVNIDIASQLTNDISAFASLDATAQLPAQGVAAGTVQPGVGNNAVTVDYAYVDFANPGPFDLNVRAGRIPSVVGIEQRVSESNQNKFINLSLVSPIMVGSQDGVAIYGSFSPVNYAVAYTNSDNLQNVANGATATTGITSGTLDRNRWGLRGGNNNGVANTATNDNNNDKFISGRLGVVPIEGLELGVSGGFNGSVYNGGLAGGAAGQPGPANNARSLLGVDASYTYGAFGIKGEWAKVSEKASNNAIANPMTYKNSLTAWYVEGTYDISSKYSVGVRYNRQGLETTGAGAILALNQTATIFDVTSLQFAGVYRIADNVQIKAEYDVNRESALTQYEVGLMPVNQPKNKNNVFALSLVGSF